MCRVSCARGMVQDGGCGIGIARSGEQVSIFSVDFID